MPAPEAPSMSMPSGAHTAESQQAWPRTSKDPRDLLAQPKQSTWAGEWVQDQGEVLSADETSPWPI